MSETSLATPPPPVPPAHDQRPGLTAPIPAIEGQGTSPSGRREAFRELRRSLTDEDLAARGVQKMLLDELERAEAECESLSGYITRFHEADKRAAILEERMRTDTALEVAFGVGVGVGGTIMGFAPTLWNNQPAGYLALIIGAILVLGGAAVRIIKR